jgi:Transposase DNA-binding
MDDRTDAWLDSELAGCSLADERLTRRLRKVLAQIGGAMGQSLPLPGLGQYQGGLSVLLERPGQRGGDIVRAFPVDPRANGRPQSNDPDAA